MPKPDPVPKFVEIKQIVVATVESSPSVAVTKLGWIAQFLADRDIKPSTKKMYSWQLKQFQRWLSFKEWDCVTENDLNRYKHYLKMRPTKGGEVGLKPASINQALAAIQSFFKWLATRRYIQFNPALTIEMMTSAASKPKKLDVSTVHQLEAGLAYRGHLCARDTAILWLLKHGLSASEIGGLDIGAYKQGGIRIKRGKRGHDSPVPLCADAQCAIDIYLLWCRSKGLDMSNTGPLFKS